MEVVKKVCKSVIIFGMAVLLSACGKANKDDIAYDLKENAGMEAGDGNAAEESDGNEIPDTISYTVEAGGRITTVDAKVYAEGYGEVPTFTATEYENKDEFVLKYAQKLFDNGEYDNVKPYGILSRAELEAELQFFQERYEDKANSNVSYIEYMLENYNEDNYVEYPDDKIVYTVTETSISVSDEGEEVNTFTNEQAYLRGNVNGKLWAMTYEKDDLLGLAYLDANCLDEDYIVVETLGMNEVNVDNPCNREGAEASAKQFLDGLGLDNMELLHTVQNNVMVSETELAVDGYTMVFGMSENGTHLLFAYEPVQTTMEAGRIDFAAVQPYVVVCVNNNGVCSFSILGNYMEPETAAKQSEMLSFEQVNEFAKEEFERMISKEFAVYTVGSVEFGYVYITYDGISYAVVPVWRYYDSGSERDTKEKTAVVTVCALDGSIIYNVPGSGSYSKILY
ncbi:MAG: hypothetical protein NC225_10015 [Clostridium sp.]|nr:hypothetical protein [Clostridium sp.]MCM1399799.1 hypothetical protein [Clostridium sp.]MCM1459574.1 hypothetical protein [Bacteroides sp.]